MAISPIMEMADLIQNLVPYSGHKHSISSLLFPPATIIHWYTTAETGAWI